MRCDSLNIPIGHKNFIQVLHGSRDLFLRNAVGASIFLVAA